MPIVIASNIGPGMLEGKALTDDSVVISNAALTPSMGPVGSASDAADLPDMSGGISFYSVHDGDTIGSVAKLFGVTPATVMSANNLSAKAALKKDAILVILPVSGTQYTIKKGDTIGKIAAKYKVDPSDINFSNNLAPDAALTAGDTILIPDAGYDGTADAPAPAKTAATPPKKTTSPSVPVSVDGLYTTNKNGTNSTPITVHPLKAYEKVDLGNAILRPVALAKSHRSQGAHGWNYTAVDIAAPLGTPIVAALDGTVLLARTGGWNGGYGNYVILLSIVDGVTTVETIYGHMSKVLVTAGQTVSRGQTIGLVGETGDATGDHVHFEVRGAKNPLIANANYTGE